MRSQSFGRNVQRAKNLIEKVKDQTGYGRKGIRAAYRRYKTKKFVSSLYVSGIPKFLKPKKKRKKANRRKRK